MLVLIRVPLSPSRHAAMSRLSPNPYSVAVLAFENGTSCIFDAESVEQPVIAMAANVGITAAFAFGWWLAVCRSGRVGGAFGARRRLLPFALLLVGPLRVHGLRVWRSATSARHLLVRSGAESRNDSWAFFASDCGSFACCGVQRSPLIDQQQGNVKVVVVVGRVYGMKNDQKRDRPYLYAVRWHTRVTIS
jgi:hypothetical protein